MSNTCIYANHIRIHFPSIYHIPQPNPHTTNRPSTPPHPCLLFVAIHLWNGFVASTPYMGLAIREQPVEDQAQNREEEHDHAPEQLVRGRAVGLQDFHCTGNYISINSNSLSNTISRGELIGEEPVKGGRTALGSSGGNQEEGVRKGRAY
jgi:hypothetical protein